MNFNHTSPYMFYGNELDSVKHLLLDNNQRVLLVSQYREVLELICRSWPDKFSISTIDNDQNKPITNLNCLALLSIDGRLKINLDVPADILVIQRKLLWLHKFFRNMITFLDKMVEHEKTSDYQAPELEKIKNRRDIVMSICPDDELMLELLEVDVALLEKQYLEIYEYKNYLVEMFNTVNLDNDPITVSELMSIEVDRKSLRKCNYGMHAHILMKNVTKEWFKNEQYQ